MKLNRVKKFPIFDVLEDGVISNPNVSDGRLFPCIIIDTDNHLDVSDLLKTRMEEATDTDLHWVQPVSSIFKSNSIVLQLSYKLPIEILFGINFNYTKDYGILDGIIQSRGFYLFSGKKGEKLSANIEKHNWSNSLLVEVPDMDIDKYWESKLNDTIRSIQKKKGIPKSKLAHAVNERIKEIREFWHLQSK